MRTFQDLRISPDSTTFPSRACTPPDSASSHSRMKASSDYTSSPSSGWTPPDSTSTLRRMWTSLGNTSSPSTSSPSPSPSSSPQGWPSPPVRRKNKKCEKQAGEKMRRARINECLSQFRAIISRRTGRELSDDDTRADVLGMVVDHLRQVAKARARQFHHGYSHCLTQVEAFLDTQPQIPPDKRHKLLSHCHRQLTIKAAGTFIPLRAAVPEEVQTAGFKPGWCHSACQGSPEDMEVSPESDSGQEDMETEESGPQPHSVLSDKQKGTQPFSHQPEKLQSQPLRVLNEEHNGTQPFSWPADKQHRGHQPLSVLTNEQGMDMQANNNPQAKPRSSLHAHRHGLLGPKRGSNTQHNSQPTKKARIGLQVQWLVGEKEDLGRHPENEQASEVHRALQPPGAVRQGVGKTEGTRTAQHLHSSLSKPVLWVHPAFDQGHSENKGTPSQVNMVSLQQSHNADCDNSNHKVGLLHQAPATWRPW